MIKAWLQRHHYKRKIIFATHLLTTGLFIWFYMVFIWIYFFTNKSTVLYINRYGEADFELVLLSLLAPISIIGLILNYIYLRRYLWKKRFLMMWYLYSVVLLQGFCIYGHNKVVFTQVWISGFLLVLCCVFLVFLWFTVVLYISKTNINQKRGI